MATSGATERPASLGTREGALAALGAEPFDLLVVGGGITGAGVALEASLRGRRVALVERADFGSGASGRSSKLVHGGLRYLIQGGVELVRASLAERAFLLGRAPGLVTPLPHLMPLRSVTESAEEVERLLTAYDGLAGDEPGVPRHRRVGAEELRSRAPVLGDDPGDGFAYYEAVTDDARLTVSVLKEAVGRGAVAVNHAALTELRTSAGRGEATVHDALSGRAHGVTAAVVVLAVGAWLAEVAGAAGLPRGAVRPAKGAHVVLRQTEPPLDVALVLRHPGDGRPVSLVPWKHHLLLGTTDAPCRADELDSPTASADDVAYLLAALGSLAPTWRPEVTAAWAGIRPLWDDPSARTTADLSREDHLVELGGGVIGVAGGKLTTFRRLGRRVVDLIEARSGRGPTIEPAAYPRIADAMLDCRLRPGEEPLVPGLPFGVGHLRIAARDERAVTLDDAVTQRLGISLVRPVEASAAAERWSHEMGAALGWPAGERAREAAAFRAGLDRFRAPAGAAAASLGLGGRP
jgi:glycerol-3-phosphate dehydrogenase